MPMLEERLKGDGGMRRSVCVCVWREGSGGGVVKGGNGGWNLGVGVRMEKEGDHGRVGSQGWRE